MSVIYLFHIFSLISSLSVSQIPSESSLYSLRTNPLRYEKANAYSNFDLSSIFAITLISFEYCSSVSTFKLSSSFASPFLRKARNLLSTLLLVHLEQIYLQKVYLNCFKFFSSLAYTSICEIISVSFSRCLFWCAKCALSRKLVMRMLE